MIATIGGNIAKAAKPKAGISATKICSPPYAEDEMQSEERIPKADFLESRWSANEWRLIGLPKSRRLIRYEIGSAKCACSWRTIGSGASSVQDFGTATLPSYRGNLRFTGMNFTSQSGRMLAACN